MAVYFEKYGTERVKGLIELGPAPIRYYRYATEVFFYLYPISEKDLLENKDEKISNNFQAIMDRISR